MSEPLEIPLADFREWLEDETRPLLEPLEAEGKSLLRDLENSLADVEAACERLLADAEREMQKGSRKTYRRSRVAYKLGATFLETIKEPTIPDEVSYPSLSSFCEAFEKDLAGMEQERARWFPRISPFFIIDRRRVDVALKRAADSFGDLQSFVIGRYEEAKVVQDLFSAMDELHSSLRELDQLKQRKKQVERRAKTLETRIAQNLQRRDQIQGENALAELEQLSKTMKDLTREVKRSLRHLQKPFLKFRKAVQGPSVVLPLGETQKLGDYLERPFEALATEKAGYPMLKELLRKLDGAIAEGKLKLKTSRLRKAKQQIDRILQKDALTTIHQRCRDVYVQKRELSTLEAVATSQSKLVKIERRLKTLGKKQRIQEARSAASDERMEQLLQSTASLRKDLEARAFELTGHRIRLVLPQASIEM